PPLHKPTPPPPNTPREYTLSLPDALPTLQDRIDELVGLSWEQFRRAEQAHDR
ncbi:hypothetical protein GOY19_23455, partial [Aeromonas hydrophila]|nr:hypothetical protein [Aeromonas hydrophila]